VLDAYDIPYDLSSFSFSNGTLPDMDIKRMDAMTVLRNSLMEESFKGSNDRFVEAVVNESGVVEFVEVGKKTTNITDVYYSMQTGQYVDIPAGVLVTAGKPVPALQPLVWQPIWYGEPGNAAAIYSAADMFANCMNTKWKSHATIVFSDPHLMDSALNDGIDNMYEITNENPWDEILGYAVYIEPPEEWATPRTTIQYNSETEIPIMIASKGTGNICPVGDIYTMPEYDPEVDDPNCWSGMTGPDVEFERGVEVVIPERFRYEDFRGSTVDKFVNISNVFIIGTEIDGLYARPKQNSLSLADITEANSDVWVSINSSRRSTFRLDEGKHYVVAYKDVDGDSFQEISIVFSQESRPYDKITYGNGIDGAGVSFRLDPMSLQAKNAEFSSGDNRGTIIPWNKTKGLLIDEIWVTAKVETPSISVYDPDGANQRALEIAKNLKYYVAPLVMRSPAAPIAFASDRSSEIVDQAPLLRDGDPTTEQNFEDTRMEQIMDIMQGTGISTTFGFLTGIGDDVDAVTEAAGLEAQEAATTIYNMIRDDVTETVYTCGPGARPELATKGPAGGIINDIKYSYNDQGSYTISVTEGPALVGNLVQVDGGPSQKMTEDNSAKGTVVQVVGDNIHFKVRVDGFGERWAINTSHNFIRQGDVVQCTLHNLPVEA